MCMNLLSRFYSMLLAFSMDQTLHVSKMVFDLVVLGLVAIFLLGCSFEGLAVVVMWK